MFPNVFPKAALPCTIYPERGIYFDSLGSFQNFPWVVLGATLDLKSWINFSRFDLKHKFFETLSKVNISFWPQREIVRKRKDQFLFLCDFCFWQDGHRQKGSSSREREAKNLISPSDPRPCSEDTKHMKISNVRKKHLGTKKNMLKNI